jgi:hypothetical protein
VPAESVPAQPCDEITDEAECLAAGCTSLVTVRPIENGDACECGAPEPLCVWAPEPLTGAPAPTIYYHQFGGSSAVFDTAFDLPPYGWYPCGHPDDNEECACVVADGGDPCAQ